MGGVLRSAPRPGSRHGRNWGDVVRRPGYDSMRPVGFSHVENRQGNHSDDFPGQETEKYTRRMKGPFHGLWSLWKNCCAYGAGLPFLSPPFFFSLSFLPSFPLYLPAFLMCQYRFSFFISFIFRERERGRQCAPEKGVRGGTQAHHPEIVT